MEKEAPLENEFPAYGVLLGNLYPYTRIGLRYGDAWWRQVCSASFLEEFFSETEHILIRCGESRRRAGKRGLELKDPDPLLCLEGRLATCRALVKP
jgi:hypothetical protein